MVAHKLADVGHAGIGRPADDIVARPKQDPRRSEAKAAQHLSTLTIRDGLLLELFEGLVERSGAQGLLWMGRRLACGIRLRRKAKSTSSALCEEDGIGWQG